MKNCLRTKHIKLISKQIHSLRQLFFLNPLGKVPQIRYVIVAWATQTPKLVVITEKLGKSVLTPFSSIGYLAATSLDSTANAKGVWF